MAKQSNLLSFLGKQIQQNKNDEEPETASATSSLDTAQSGLKRERKLQAVWLEKYKWLSYRDGVMLCETCISATSLANPFTEGCTNFENSTYLRHQESKIHMNSVQVLTMCSNFVTACKTALEISDEELSAKLNEYVIQLCTLYVMIKRDIPADAFSDLMHLQNLNGVKCTYYKRLQVLMEMEHCIEQVVFECMAENIKNSAYIGVMLDETCDISVHKKLAIYLRYVVDGEAVVSFAGNEEIYDCTASGIEEALINFLITKGFSDENVSQVFGLGTVQMGLQ